MLLKDKHTLKLETPPPILKARGHHSLTELQVLAWIVPTPLQNRHFYARLSPLPDRITGSGLLGLPWASLGFLGPPWASLGVSGPPWASLGLPGPFRASLGLAEPRWAYLGLAGRP